MFGVGYGFCTSADLSDADVSTKGPGWRGDEQVLVSGAQLGGRKLEKASGRRAFLARGNLHGAHLEGADFTQADLRWADLSESNLEQTVFAGADLRGANFHGAYLVGTDLRGARLDGAVGLTQAQLASAIQ